MQRPEVPFRADERTTLVAWLERHRATLAMKCEGLSHAQLRERAVLPSTLSLLGLIRHLAEVERGWLRRTLAGEEVGFLFSSPEDPDGDFDHVDEADVDEALAVWWRESIDGVTGS